MQYVNPPYYRVIVSPTLPTVVKAYKDALYYSFIKFCPLIICEKNIEDRPKYTKMLRIVA